MSFATTKNNQDQTSILVLGATGVQVWLVLKS